MKLDQLKLRIVKEAVAIARRRFEEYAEAGEITDVEAEVELMREKLMLLLSPCKCISDVSLMLESFDEMQFYCNAEEAALFYMACAVDDDAPVAIVRGTVVMFNHDKRMMRGIVVRKASLLLQSVVETVIVACADPATGDQLHCQLLLSEVQAI